MKRTLLTFILTKLVFYIAVSQYIGLPRTRNFTKEDYKADAPNWAACRDSKGIMYFGNPYGLLEFNGVKWNLVARPDNKSAVRSLAIDKNDRIYVGGNNEIGYAERNIYNQKYYVSLNDKIPEEYRSFGVVWNTIIQSDRVVFQTPEALYLYENDTITVIVAPKHFDCITKTRDNIVVSEIEGGLFYLKGNELEHIPHSEQISGIDLSFVLPFDKDSYLIGVENVIYVFRGDKLIEWESDINNEIKNRKLFCGTLISEELFAVGTFDNGAYFFDRNGKIVNHLHYEKGLNSNSVTNFFKDEDQNIWLTMFNGIAFVDLSSSFKYYGAESGLFGSVYSSSVYKNKLFIGTNQGVYCAHIENNQISNDRFNKFELVPNSVGAIWNLEVIDGELYVNSHFGFFKLVDNKLKEIHKSSDGSWKQSRIPTNSNFMVQGTYRGFLLYEKRNGEWEFIKKVKGFSENGRQFTFDKEGNLWVVNGLKGIYKLKLNQAYDSIHSVSYYDESKGLPSNLYNSLITLNDKLYFGTRKGIFKYDPASDEMVADNYYNDIITSETIVRRLVQSADNKLFYIYDYDSQDRIGEISFLGNGEIENRNWPFQSLRGKFIPAFEDINYLSNEIILFGLEEGIAIYNSVSNSSRNKNRCNITHARVTVNDSLIYGDVESEPTFNELGITAKDSDFKQMLPYSLNAIKFSYAATAYGNSDEIEYQTYLEGFDKEWSNWTFDAEREFTNLPPGEYVFHVKAKDVFGNIGEQDSYEYVILPPWYLSKLMYIFYFLLFGFLIAGVVNWQLKTLKKEKEKIKQQQEKKINEMEDKHRKELMVNEMKIFELENEKLTAENEHKEKELASTTIHLVQMNEALAKVKTKLEELNQLNKIGSGDIIDVCNFIDETIQNEETNKNFELHFNKVHDNFLKRLKEDYPGLSNRDLRLCAYLRMNISSKEIAPLMGITYRSVEALRYRVRKKFNLQQGESLTEFIIGF